MSVPKNIPSDARFIQTLTRFTALFNVPVLGKYSFAAVGVPVLFPLSKTSIYLIDRFGFSADLDSDVFQNAIINVPVLQLRKKNDAQVIFPKPLPLILYAANCECTSFFNTPTEGDQLLADFTGLIDQTAALVGVASVTCQFTLNMYEVLDVDWTKAYKKPTKSGCQK